MRRLIVCLAAVFAITSINTLSPVSPNMTSAQATEGWQISMMYSGKKVSASLWNTGDADFTNMGSPGSGSFQSSTASSTGANSRLSIGAGVGLYKGFFEQTNITRVALVDGSSSSLNPTNHNNYLIYDLVESSGSESLEDILKRLDEYQRTATSFDRLDNVWGNSSVLNHTAGTNGYSGTLSSSGGTAFRDQDGDLPDKFAVMGINRDSDNDIQALAAYSGDLQNGKGDSWRNQNPPETFWSYWGNDFHSESKTQRIGSSLQSAPGIPTGVTSYDGDVYLMTFGGTVELNQPTAPTVTTTTAQAKSLDVSWATDTEASSYTLRIYSSADVLLQTVTGITTTSKTLTASDYSGFEDGTSYKISVQSAGDGTFYTDSPESNKTTASTNNVYTVTYDSNGGDTVADGSFVSGGSISQAPAQPNRSGFSFDGWSDTDGGALISFPYTPGVNQPITLFAEWTGDALTPTFSTATRNSAGFSFSVTNFNADFSWAVSASAGSATIDGNGFIDVTGLSLGQSSTVTVDTTRTGYTSGSASFSSSALSAYVITYKPGSQGTGSEQTQSKTPGAPIQLFDESAASSAFNRTGHSITGWTTTDGSAETNALESTYSTDADLILFPVWSINSYTLTLDNEGTTTTQSVEFDANPSNPNLTKQGHTLDGWSDTNDNTAEYLPDLSDYQMPASIDTLFAVWSINSYTLTLDNEGTTTTQSVEFDANPTDPGLTKQGHTLDGWSDANDNTAEYLPDLSDYQMPASIDTLFAVWSINSYTLTLDNEGTTTTESVEFDANPTDPGLTKQGHTLDGWSDTNDNTADYLPDLSDYQMPASIDTLFAVWSPETYVVSYNANQATAGSSPAGQTKTFGVDLTVRDNTGSLERTGFSFVGWNDQADGQGQDYASNTGIYSAETPVVLFAKWSINSYTLTLDNEGTTTTQSVEFMANPTDPDVSKPGFVLEGWSDEADETAEYLADLSDYTMPASIDTLFAVWVVAPVTGNIPYTGPLITSVESPSDSEFARASQSTVILRGERLEGVTRAVIDGQETEILNVRSDLVEIVIPEGLVQGTYDVQIETSLGNLTYLDAFVIAPKVSVVEYEEVSSWTKRISDTELKVYVKFPTVGEKVRISHQVGGSGDYNTVYVKTTSSETMEGLKIVEGVGTYIVRTIDLAEINRIRVTVGDEVLVQVRYNN